MVLVQGMIALRSHIAFYHIGETFCASRTNGLIGNLFRGMWPSPKRSVTHRNIASRAKRISKPTLYIKTPFAISREMSTKLAAISNAKISPKVLIAERDQGRR